MAEAHESPAAPVDSAMKVEVGREALTLVTPGEMPESEQNRHPPVQPVLQEVGHADGAAYTYVLES